MVGNFKLSFAIFHKARKETNAHVPNDYRIAEMVRIQDLFLSQTLKERGCDFQTYG